MSSAGKMGKTVGEKRRMLKQKEGRSLCPRLGWPCCLQEEQAAKGRKVSPLPAVGPAATPCYSTGSSFGYLDFSSQKEGFGTIKVN